MTKQDDGGGAFPCGVMQDGHNPGQEPWQRGLSIRDYFAASALQAYVSLDPETPRTERGNGLRPGRRHAQGEGIVTPEQEIAGLKRLCEAWRKDCQRYETGLRDVRKLATQGYDESDHESDRWLELVTAINRVLAHEDSCATCGDHHADEMPLACRTGDGV